jgi:ABC-2 type transport system ATP-binding protein
VLNLRTPMAVAPRVEGYALTLVDDTTLEAGVSNEQGLNNLFAQLALAGVEVVSMRNKVNRLEEVFMQLVEHRGHGA